MHKNHLWLSCVVIGASILLLGCQQHPPVRTAGGPRAVTLGIDARDYNQIAAELFNSLMMHQGLKENAVIALAPVAESFDGNYHFDARTFQEKLQVLAMRSGRFRFSFAVDVMDGESPAAERMRIMQLQYERERTVDPEDLRVFGDLADIDYMIFGRVSSITSQLGRRREVTFNFSWRLGNCVNGLLEWGDQVSITKGH